MAIIKKVDSFIKSPLESSAYKKIQSKLTIIPRKNKIVGIIIFIVAIALSIKFLQMTKQDTKKNTNTPRTTITMPKLIKGTPDYLTVLPKGKTIAALGGWTRISPPDASPVYTYIDKIGNVQINVSEQPLPDSFKPNPLQQLQQLAKNENATDKITVGNIAVYIGTSSNGPQSAFFIKNNLLILIKSDSIINQNQWIEYIDFLQ